MAMRVLKEKELGEFEKEKKRESKTARELLSLSKQKIQM